MAEYEDVLDRPELKLSAELTKATLHRIRRAFAAVVPRKRVVVALDPDDNKVLECALEARADYIVTGNLRHFPERFQNVRILAPKDFLTIFESEL